MICPIYMLTYESGEFAYNQGHNIYGTLEQKAALRAIIVKAL